MAVPSVRKISETIIDFGEPLIGQLDGESSIDTVRSAFNIVITVWNAHVTALPRWGQPRFLAELNERMQDPRTPIGMAEAVRALSQRRLEHFATDARAVGEWDLEMRSGRWHLRCDARAPELADTGRTRARPR
jgi:hypothetical protein